MDEEAEHEERRRIVRIPVPWSRNPIEFRGYDLVLVLSAASLPFIAYFLYVIYTDGEHAHLKIMEALNEQTYVLSLPQEKREALNISMPESLKTKIRKRRQLEREE
jgi:hypothetical protein